MKSLWLLLLLGANAALFLLPLLPALREWRRRGNAPLHIPTDDEAGIGYFASRFRERLAADWDDAALFAPPAADDPPRLAAWQAAFARLPAALQRHYRLAAEPAVRGALRLDDAEQPILLGDELRLARGTHLLGDVYARRRLLAEGGNVLRAVLCDGELVLGSNSGILRWAHARRVSVGAGSRAMGRISADETIRIAAGCRFERVAAPCLHFGDGGGDEAGPEPGEGEGAGRHNFDLAGLPRVEHQAGAARWLCQGHLAIPDDSLVDGDLVVRGDLRVGARCRIRGGVKVHGTLQLGAGSEVDGAVFATGGIDAGAGCALAGPVSSGRDVRLGSGSRVGRRQRPTSLVAPTIVVAGDCTCYGSIWARRDGHTST